MSTNGGEPGPETPLTNHHGDVRPNESGDTDPNESGEVESSETSPSKSRNQKAPTALPDLLKSPQALAAIQGKLQALVGQSSGYIENLPTEVKRRVDALRNLSLKQVRLEAKFYEEVHELEKKYMKDFQELYDKRRDIVTGDVEPSDEECKWELSEWPEANDEATIEEVKDGETAEKEPCKKECGIPSFWLTTMKNIQMIEEMIQDHDEPILEHLVDIRVVLDCPGHDVPNFCLEFHFSGNDYFNNKLLSKLYILDYGPSDTLDDVVNYEGPHVKDFVGCKIDWKKGKNVTVKTIKKKQKHKSAGQTRTVTKTVHNDSFFNFFQDPRDGGNEEDGLEQLLESEADIGTMFRDRIVPKAVFYFTGEADGEDELDDEDEEESGDDEDEDDDPDYEPIGEDGKIKTPECRQQ